MPENDHLINKIGADLAPILFNGLSFITSATTTRIPGIV